MPSSYSKPHLTFEKQVRHLRDKGMIINDEALALRQLSQIGYYRLSAYWHPFKLRGVTPNDGANERFKEGTTFEHAQSLYDFDRKLRRLILEGIELLEVSLRVEVSYRLGAKDPFAHMNKDMWHGKSHKEDCNGKSAYMNWVDDYKKKAGWAGEDFTEHLIKKYGDPLPIWVSVELWDLSLLNNFFRGLRQEDKGEISKKYLIDDPECLQTWLKAIKGMRNHAAHHGRVWNRSMAAQPTLPKRGLIPELDFIIDDATNRKLGRVCCPLVLMLHMLTTSDSECEWPHKLRELLTEFPCETGFTIEQMGFPATWPIN
jgi:abortive infection bacteriophage resistance protein